MKGSGMRVGVCGIGSIQREKYGPAPSPRRDPQVPGTTKAIVTNPSECTYHGPHGMEYGQKP